MSPALGEDTESVVVEVAKAVSAALDEFHFEVAALGSPRMVATRVNSSHQDK